MAYVISIVNFKGGVGKTTIAVNLATTLAKDFNKRVLLVDFDAQMNATTHILSIVDRYDELFKKGKTIYHAMLKKKFNREAVNLDDYILKETFKNNNDLALVPNLHLLAGATNMVDFESILGTYQKNNGLPFLFLNELLSTVHGNYDFIIIDTSPYLGNETKNSILASNGYIVPLIPEPFSKNGLNVLLNKIHSFSTKHPTYKNTFTEFLGVVFTHFRSRVTDENSFIDWCRDSFNSKHILNYGIQPGAKNNIFNTYLSYRPKPYRKSVSENLPLFKTKDSSTAVSEFHDLAEELLEKIK